MTTYQVVPPSSKLVYTLKYSYSYTINHKVTNPFSDLGHHLEDGLSPSPAPGLVHAQGADSGAARQHGPLVGAAPSRRLGQEKATGSMGVEDVKPLENCDLAI